MTKGKIAAQVGHAVQYLIYDQLITIPSKVFLEWINNNATKICLKVKDETELLLFKQIGDDHQFNSTLVVDNGYTHFEGIKTNTVVGWGPIYKNQHDALTSHLKLL